VALIRPNETFASVVGVGAGVGKVGHAQYAYCQAISACMDGKKGVEVLALQQLAERKGINMND
jgi:hypothetical protein